MISPCIPQHESRETLPQVYANESPADVPFLGYSALKDTVLIDNLYDSSREEQLLLYEDSKNVPQSIEVASEDSTDDEDNPALTNQYDDLFVWDYPNELAPQYDELYVWSPPSDLAPQYDEVYVPPPPEVDLPFYEEFIKIAKCESGLKWGINTGNSFYGGLQFTQQSWEGSGGLDFAPRADLATPYEQIVTAHRLKELQGFGAWPACAKNLGLLS